MVGFEQFFFLKTYFNIPKSRTIELQLNIAVLQKHKDSVNIKKYFILLKNVISYFFGQFLNRKKLKDFEIYD